MSVARKSEKAKPKSSVQDCLEVITKPKSSVQDCLEVITKPKSSVQDCLEVDNGRD